MASFDSFLSIDYSAASTPTRGENAIWVGGKVLGQAILVNFYTRAALHDWLDEVLHRHIQEGARLIAGFDFAFGYPRGFAAALGLKGSPWQKTWALLCTQISDATDNANNRFAVANALNQKLRHRAVFWGRPAHLPLADLPPTKLMRYDQGLAEWRAFEAEGRKAPGAASGAASGSSAIGRMQPGWKLAYPGSVGSQSLMGIARLERHRRTFADQLAIWPFQAADRPLVFAEVYPSLFEFDHIDHPVKDARQVLATAAALEAADLGQWLNRVPFKNDPAICSEEGWLLGWPA